MYACIDLGSNSFHLLIAEWKDNKIQLIERCSDKVQIGEGVLASGKISAEAFERGLASLRHFKSLINQHPVNRYWALGTNTFRNAENADDFIDEAAKIGIEISVISGVQEAMLIYAGVISGLPSSDDKRLVIDIGGGSTEVIVGRKHRRLITHSLPVGCVAWRDRFFSGAGSDPIQLGLILDESTEAAGQIFRSIAPGVTKYDWIDAYASSGTAKMLTAVCQEHKMTQGKISIAALDELRGKMVKAIAGGQPLPGLKDKRRDLLLPGYAVMKGLMQAYGCQSVQFSATAMREGMLDFMVKKRKTIRGLKRNKLPEVRYAAS